MSILNTLPLITLFSFTLVLKRMFSSWLAPPVFFSSLWTFFILVPLIFAPQYPINSYGLWVITLFVYALGIGSFIGNNITNNQIIHNVRILNKKTFKPLFFIVEGMLFAALAKRFCPSISRFLFHQSL